ncbi:MAG: cytochrome c [Pseudomonadota bacterium]|nr:cytochrome c [Pseudomonadota bacterium]
MTNTRFHASAIALFAALALAACSGSEPANDHAAADEHATADEHAEGKSSSAGLPSGHLDAGAKRALAKSEATGQTCIDCHGKDGNVPLDPTYPKLGGQYHDYLAHALQMYRSGGREHALMSAQAKNLTDQEIADLSAYFASRPNQLSDLHGLE